MNPEGLWIVDQHVAHERVLFEKILKQRAAQKVESQRLLLPLVLELTPAQQAVVHRNLRRTGQERIRSRTLRRPQRRGKDRARRESTLPQSSTCCMNCSTSFPAKSKR